MFPDTTSSCPPLSPPTKPCLSLISRQPSLLFLPLLSPLGPALPLREVDGAQGIVQVQNPFSMSNLAYIERCLGSFSTHLTTFTKEFEYLTQSYNLTWHDIYVFLSCSLTPEEKEHIWLAALDHAHALHRQDMAANPVGACMLPQTDLRWDYLVNSPGRSLCSHMITCLITGLQKAAHKAVNYDKQ